MPMQDIRKIHECYYKNHTLASKKAYILQHCTVSSATDSPVVQSHIREMSTKFELPIKRSGLTTNIRVCRATYLHILQESRDRVQLLCKKFLKEQRTPLLT